MRLSVVVLNWNQADDTRRCVEAVDAWRRRDVAIVVVDNASEAGEAERLSASLPSVSIIASKSNRGFAGGTNLGIAAALETNAEAVLLLNNDASITAANLERLEKRLAEDSTIGVVGPTLWSGERLVSAGGRDIALHRQTHWSTIPDNGGARDVDYVPGAVALIRRSVFDAVDLFDEDYFFAGEMADLCARARSAGMRSVIEPQARAEHDVERSSVMRARLHVYYVFRNRFLFAKKHHSRRRRRLYLRWSAYALSAAIRAALAGRRAQARVILLGLGDALAGRFGGQNERVL